MKSIVLILVAVVVASLAFSLSTQADPTPNSQIDYEQFKQLVIVTEDIRAQRRLSEEQFMDAIESGEYVLLDARSQANYQLRHIKGAVNLPFTEFTADSLSELIPNRDSKILIYCNNNFRGAPESFALKAAPASLNLNTQASLAAYGYTQVYELGPALDVNDTIIPFEGTETQWARLEPIVPLPGF